MPWRRPQDPGSVSGRATRALVVPVATVAMLLAGGLAASTAYAQPTPEEIEAQIDRAWRELAPVIEQHNATREELKEKKAQAKELEDEIAPLQLKVDRAIAEVSELALHAYTTGDTSAFNALLTSGSPYTFAEQLTVLDQIAKRRRAQIAKVVKAKEKYEERKAELDALIDELSAMEKELAEKAEEIDAEIERLQALRIEAYGRSGGVGELRPAACPAEYYGDAGSEAAKFACEQVGKPYAWGASGPDAYDCSGLTMAAWSRAGVGLPHNAAQQRNVTRYVDRSELRPGDLVFYYGDLSHVAIYVGDGWIVDASQPGVPVKMRSMDAPGPIHSYGRP
jgi:cell wall-associated NlpC family hydrolase